MEILLKNEYLIGDCFLGSTHCGSQASLWHSHRAMACGSGRGPGDRTHGFPQGNGFRMEKCRILVKIQGQEHPILEKSIICLIRVRGFPLRDILSLRASGDGLGQARKIVGAPPSPPSASFS